MARTTLAAIGLALALTLSTQPGLLHQHPDEGKAPGAHSDIMIAANEGKPEESAKMGKEEGARTQPGAQPLTKEDCKKAGLKWNDKGNVCG